MVVTRRQIHHEQKSNGDSGIAAHPLETHHSTTPIKAAVEDVSASIVHGSGDSSKNKRKEKTTPTWVFALLLAFSSITYLTIPHPLHPAHGQEPSMQHVFYYGWLTAMSTGLGALPFLLFPDVASFWVGISNGTFFVSILSYDA
jgi:hypothetical protein